MKWFVVLMLACIAAVVAGCKDSAKTETPQPAAAQAGVALPAGLILTDAPKQPLDVLAAKKELKAGDDVVVRGRIGGRVEPFVAGRAIFQLVDSSVPTCAEMPMKCETPWDYCCEPKDQLTARSLTVQVVGPDGKPLPISLKGQSGLNPMARVVIQGKVEQKPDEKVMIIRADGIYVDTSTTQPTQQSRPAADASAKVVYTCPMHPEVVSDHPGKCPKCGMDLEAKK